MTLFKDMFLQDVGGSLPSNIALKDISSDVSPIFNSNASESLKNQISDVLDFLTDFHTVSKVKVSIFIYFNIYILRDKVFGFKAIYLGVTSSMTLSLNFKVICRLTCIFK